MRKIIIYLAELGIAFGVMMAMKSLFFTTEPGVVNQILAMVS